MGRKLIAAGLPSLHVRGPERIAARPGQAGACSLSAGSMAGISKVARIGCSGRNSTKTAAAIAAAMPTQNVEAIEIETASWMALTMAGMSGSTSHLVTSRVMAASSCS